MMLIHSALVIHVCASVDVSSLVYNDLAGFGDTDYDAMSLLQLRARATGLEECVLVQGDAVSDSFAPALAALEIQEEWTDPGGTGDPVQSLEECYNRVKSMNDLSIRRGQPPVCTGLSLPTGGSGQCYCQRGITGTDENPAWQSCKFGGFSEADLFPGRDSLAAEALGCFFQQGEGTGRRDLKIHNGLKSKEECVNLAKERCPDANGVTMNDMTPEMMSRFGSGCWCEFEQTGRNTNGAYLNCELGVEPEEVVIDGAGFDGTCDWYEGTTDGSPEQTPKATSPEHCAQMVRQQCPDANAASLRITGSGECTCQRGATNSCLPGGNGVCAAKTTWQSCRLDVPSTTTPKPVQDEAAAVGDPHLEFTNGHHADMCCHQGHCALCADQ